MPEEYIEKNTSSDYTPDDSGIIILMGSRETVLSASRSMAESGYELIHLREADEVCQLAGQRKGEIRLLLIEVVEQEYVGIETLRALRILPESERIPILAIVEGHQAAVDSIRCGAFDYIPRIEVHTAAFVERVERLIKMTGTAFERSGTDKETKAPSEILDMLRHVNYARIAQALSRDYLGIYYVDLDKGSYVEYSASSEYESLGLGKRGYDFFGESIENIKRVVYSEDQQRLIDLLSERSFLEELRENDVYTVNYRLLFGGQPTYVRMKITRLGDIDDPYIVIGVYSVQREIDQLRESSTYSNIARALAADYFSIYYVDTETDEFIEFSSTDNYLDLGIEKRGSDFFNLSRKNVKRVIYPEDQKMLIKAMDKGYILHELDKNGTYTLTYRLMYGGKPTYVSLKATKMKDPGDTHIVIGITSIEAQIKRERELNTAREMASRDALTGVKSKYAFVETQEQINAQIEKGSLMEFAVIVCDLNDLKVVNDTLGHNAGDK